jgi:DMSO/TMAO reductase YedYZ molybdopterin-dependent catalytic subunit/thiosulfate reductase cytochrome b subunit
VQPLDLELSAGVRLAHFFNFLFLSLLVRSGVEILGAHPKLYWRDDCAPGTEWLRFTGKRLPASELWTAEDEAEAFSPWVALPGRGNLGLGRHWHRAAALGWLACGLVYVAILVAGQEWARLVPTSLSILPEAWSALAAYTRGELPASGPGPYNPLQQLAYFGLVFVLAPIQILSGLAMSPALAARFPSVLGGHQAARSVHFLGLAGFVGFFAVHLALVVIHGLGAGMARVVWGDATAPQASALAVGGSAIAAVIALNAWATRVSLRRPRAAQRWLERGADSLQRGLFHHWSPRARERTPSRFARVNGRPPRNTAYARARAAGFADWRLRVDGLVEAPLTLSLAELRALPRAEHASRHVCIQGWTYCARWAGVPLQELLARARPQPSARYVVVHTCDEKWERPGHGSYYEVIDLETARKPHAIVAYEMNGAPLPVEHGAPLRLRVEHQLGYKMAKWVDRLELVAGFHDIGAGRGGWRDDLLHYPLSDAGI